MSIRLQVDKEDNLRIDATQQPDFKMAEHGFLLVFPFRTVERGSTYVVIDPKGCLTGVLDHVVAELERAGFRYELDPYLKGLWNSYIDEQSRVKLIRRKPFSGRRRRPRLKDMFRSERRALDHQIRGIAHAIEVGNAANFSVPGSGKTQIALGVFAHWKANGSVDKAMVIGPGSCFEPWESEASDCLAHPLNILRWSGSIENRRRIAHRIDDVDIVLVTYQTACNDLPLLEQVLRKYRVLLILDESHLVKNPDGVRAQAVLRLAPLASKRLILTGTPAPHSVLDVWTQFSFLWPSLHLLGDYYKFRDDVEYTKKPLPKLKRILSPFFVRTTKEDLKLPKVSVDTIVLEKSHIPAEQRKIIELLELRTLVDARKMLATQADLDLLRNWRRARVIRLLQAAANPALLLNSLRNHGIDNTFDVDLSELSHYVNLFVQRKKTSAKIDTVISLVRSLVAAGNKTIVWSWFVENIELLEDLLKEFHPLKIYGQTKPYEEGDDTDLEESRERNIREFKHGKSRPILLANPAACAESISLHKHCQHAVYLDRNFNCGQFLQSMDRIHRVGMPPGLTAVYHIPVIDCAIERAVDRRLKIRQRVLYDLLNDPMPVLGIAEDSWLADSEEELEAGFETLLKEIQSESPRQAI